MEKENLVIFRFAKQKTLDILLVHGQISPISLGDRSKQGREDKVPVHNLGGGVSHVRYTLTAWEGGRRGGRG